MTYPLPRPIESERLLLRPITAEDLPVFIKMHQDEKVTAFLGGDGRPRSPEKSQVWFDTIQRWYREDGVGPFAIVLRDTGQIIGRSGISFFEVELVPSRPNKIFRTTSGKGSMTPGTDFKRILEVGYVVHPNEWGHGYGTEAAKSWYQYGFQERDEDALYSLIHGDNLASIRVAEKNGLSRSGEIWNLDGRDFFPYKMTPEEWSIRNRSQD